jgi:hypothetical protein
MGLTRGYKWRPTARLWVLRDFGLRVTALGRPRSNYTVNYRSVLSSERAPYMKKKESNFHSKKCNIWSPAPKRARHQDELTASSNIIWTWTWLHFSKERKRIKQRKEKTRKKKNMKNSCGGGSNTSIVKSKGFWRWITLGINGLLDIVHRLKF